MTQTTPATELNPKSFDILRHAVNLARNERIPNVACLRARLETAYPDSTQDINNALVFWAQRARPTENRCKLSGPSPAY